MTNFKTYLRLKIGRKYRNVRAQEERQMETVLAKRAISMSAFKASPKKSVDDAGGEPLAVLSHSKPVFYAVPPKLFEQINEILDDHEIAEIVRKRLTKPDLVEVTLDDL